MPKCYFCNRECDEEDYCVGCGEYICSKCDLNDCMGDHVPEDHAG